MTLQADNKVIEQLSKWEQPYIELYRRLLGLNVEDSYLPTLNAHISKVTERFTQGGFLKFKDLLPDWAEVEKLFKEATSIVIEYSSTAATLNELTKHQLVRRATQAWY
jgi:hypothetical protein